MCFRTRSLVSFAGAIALAIFAVCLVAAPVRAQLSPSDLLSAIVGLEITVPADARTADTLGTTRQGSGIVIDNDGLIVTIGYLILEADAIEVRTASGKRFPAGVVAYHGESGFGLLRARGGLGAKPMKLGQSGPVAGRQPVLVAAFGGTEALRPAVVAARRDFAGPWEYAVERAIFTAPPHPNFGGAGLIGEDGRLLGVGYLAVGSAIEGEGYFPGNMFVPIDVLKPIMADLLNTGRVPGPARPWLGIYSEEVKGRLFVNRVAEDGPADAAGIRPGDILLSVGGQPIADMMDFYRKLWSRGEAGTEVPLTILQGMELREISVKSSDRYKWFRTPRSF